MRYLECGDYKVYKSRVLTEFVAKGDRYDIVFNADQRNGEVCFNIVLVRDKEKDRTLRSPRLTTKFRWLVRDMAQMVASNW